MTTYPTDVELSGTNPVRLTNKFRWLVRKRTVVTLGLDTGDTEMVLQQQVAPYWGSPYWVDVPVVTEGDEEDGG